IARRRPFPLHRPRRPPYRVEVPPGESLQVRARAGLRALVRIGERPGDWHFFGGEASVLTLDGLMVYGSQLRVGGGFELVRVRHCTLSACDVPPPRCPPDADARNSGVLFDLDGPRARVEVAASIVGPV